MKYLDHVRSKEPHERRRHALVVAGVITGVFFIAWLATLPVRLATNSPANNPADTSLSAAAAQSQVNSGPGVEVSSTSVYSLPDESQ